ncbi:CD99 antigen-like protein 2 [Rhinoraja longicauda]
MPERCSVTPGSTAPLGKASLSPLIQRADAERQWVSEGHSESAAAARLVAPVTRHLPAVSLPPSLPGPALSQPPAARRPRGTAPLTMARALRAVLLCAALTLLLERVSGDNGLDLADAFSDDSSLTPTPAKPRKQTGGTGTGDLDLADYFDFDSDKPTTTRSPKRTTTKAPKKRSDDGDLSLLDLFTPPHKTTKAPGTTKKPPKQNTGSGGIDFDLADALDDRNDNSKGNRGNSDRPSTPSSKGNKEGGSDLSDSDLDDLLGGDGYKPDERKKDDPLPPDDQKEVAMPETTIAGIASAVAATLLGAISSYIAYQKKQLCFKVQGSLNQAYVKGENVEAGTMSEPQAERSLLETQSEKPPADIANKV